MGGEETFSPSLHPLTILLHPDISITIPNFKSNQYYDLYQSRLVLPILEILYNLNYIVYTFASVLICSTLCLWDSPSCSSFCCSIVFNWMYRPLFIHFKSVEHLGYFLSLVLEIVLPLTFLYMSLVKICMHFCSIFIC